MFSSALVCLLVNGITQNYSTCCRKVWRKDATWATEETVRFWW